MLNGVGLVLTVRVFVVGVGQAAKVRNVLVDVFVHIMVAPARLIAGLERVSVAFSAVADILVSEALVFENAVVRGTFRRLVDGLPYPVGNSDPAHTRRIILFVDATHDVELVVFVRWPPDLAFGRLQPAERLLIDMEDLAVVPRELLAAYPTDDSDEEGGSWKKDE